MYLDFTAAILYLFFNFLFSSNQNLCEHCNKTFKTTSSKNRHLREVHNDNSKNSGRSFKITCVLCYHSECVPASFSSFLLLMDHLSEKHNIKCDIENLNFNSKEEFDEWKRNTEKQTKSFYCLKTACESAFGKVLYFECQRSNLINFKSKCQVRAPKINGSIKMNGVCPSRIRAEILQASGKIAVTYTSTHVGHTNELRYQPLHLTEKKWIIEQIRNGVSYGVILKKAKCIENAECSRLNFLKIKDIHYLAKKIKLDEKRNVSDFVTVVANTKVLDTTVAHPDEDASMLMDVSSDDDIQLREEVTSSISEQSTTQHQHQHDETSLEQQCKTLFDSLINKCKNDEEFKYILEKLLQAEQHLSK